MLSDTALCHLLSLNSTPEFFHRTASTTTSRTDFFLCSNGVRNEAHVFLALNSLSFLQPISKKGILRIAGSYMMSSFPLLFIIKFMIFLIHSDPSLRHYILHHGSGLTIVFID